jgi:ribosomal protein S18 acetylase RimI-like enzyme
MSPERATAKAVADIERLLPGGSLPDEHSIYVLEADGVPVGDLWLAERDDGARRSLFVFDITVDEPFRARGHGKAAMRFAEAEARQRGLSRLALWVGGRNEPARHLYRSLGYEENAIAMSKPVLADAADAAGTSVRLRPMRDDEFAGWLPLMRDGYAQAMTDEGGVPPEVATERAAVELEYLFPGGRPSADQPVFVIEADGEAAGDLWLCERDDTPQPCLFVYDIRVDEAYRGRGCGKAAMLFAEDEARRRGRDRVALNVFGRNTVARGLYLSLGYDENAVSMSKTL